MIEDRLWKSAVWTPTVRMQHAAGSGLHNTGGQVQQRRPRDLHKMTDPERAEGRAGISGPLIPGHQVVLHFLGRVSKANGVCQKRLKVGGEVPSSHANSAICVPYQASLRANLLFYEVAIVITHNLSSQVFYNCWKLENMLDCNEKQLFKCLWQSAQEYLRQTACWFIVARWA